MNKKIIAVLALAALVTTGAFAQLALGISGNIYTDTKMSGGEVINRFQDGNGIFYGPFVEIGLGKLALGGAANFSFYEEDWSIGQDGSWMMKMVDYDVNVYVQGHLLGYKAIFDPFAEAGLGVMGKNFQEEQYQNTDPLSMTTYFQAGLGLGLNLGGLGLFFKTNYLFPGDPVQTEAELYNPDGTPSGSYATYTLPMYDLKRMKITLGAKLIL